MGYSKRAIKAAEREQALAQAKMDLRDVRAELAGIYREKARDVVMSIRLADIDSASLQQKSVSSGILLDKALLLSGDAPSVNVEMLLEVAHAIRKQQQARVGTAPTSACTASA